MTAIVNISQTIFPMRSEREQKSLVQSSIPNHVYMCASEGTVSLAIMIIIRSNY